MNKDDTLKWLMEKYSLNMRQAMFVLLYDGNATDAARRAGYRHPNTHGSRLLANDGIKSAISALTERIRTHNRILTREDLMKIWSQIATDKDAKVHDRMKAMDSLAKAQGIFIDRSQIISNVRIEHLDKLTDQELLDKLDSAIRTLQDAGVTLALPEST